MVLSIDDKEDRQSCFGVAKLPVNSLNIEEKNEMWLWKSFSG